MEWSAVMRLFGGLEAEGVDYVLIGGVAVNLHGLDHADAARLAQAFGLDVEER